MIGTTLFTVSRLLSAWESEGLIESGRPASSCAVRPLSRPPTAMANPFGVVGEARSAAGSDPCVKGRAAVPRTSLSASLPRAMTIPSKRERANALTPLITRATALARRCTRRKPRLVGGRPAEQPRRRRRE